MTFQRLLQNAAVAMAGCGMLASPSFVLAAEAPQAARTAPAVQITDVALDAHGYLHGQVVDTQGAPQSGVEVLLERDAHRVSSVRTDKKGNFAAPASQGGHYRVRAGQTEGVYRVWTAAAAPPSARRGLLLVDGRTTARAQGQGGGNGGLLMLGIAGAIVGAGVASQSDSGS